MEKVLNIVDKINKQLSENVSVVSAKAEDVKALDLPTDLKEGILKAVESDMAIQAAAHTFLAYELYDGTALVFYKEGISASDKDLLTLLALNVNSEYDERDFINERKTFLKNVLLENELPGDIPLKARDLEIDYFSKRQVVLLRFGEPCDGACVSLLREKFRPNDFILSLDEKNVIIIAEMEDRPADAWDSLSTEILEYFEDEGRQLHIGIGMLAEHLKDTATSFRQASLALTVGHIFNEEDKIVWYKRLGLGRLIYQLPPKLCEMFLSEVFAPDTYEALDPETLLTIEKFFENNLNGSETSRQLFVHRNTLVYRLDKVQKITGLDLRTFEDAVLFKLASMVRQYLESLQQRNEAQTLNRHW